MTRCLIPVLAAAMAAACTAEPEPAPGNAAEAPPPAAAEPSSEPPETPAAPTPDASPAPLIGERVARGEWAEADNREACAAIALADDGDGEGTARAADFAGGWAVAFDEPGLRSAYGFAGPGLIDADDAAPVAQRERLTGQWPYFRDLGHLPQPAFAGYGLSGAEPYPAGAANARGPQSIAYVRIGDQSCTYNVWSKLGRAHLETLLANLRLLPE